MSEYAGSTTSLPPTKRAWGSSRRVAVVAGALLLVALALWLRFRAIGITSLWIDDAWVADGSQVSTFGDTIRSGLTSPGFSLVYRGWAEVFGERATTAQLLALGIGVVTPVVMFLAALERRLPMYAALLAGTVLATAPAHIVFSTRLKQYTAEALLATLVLWAAWRVLEDVTSRGRWALLTAVGIAASLISSVGVVVAGTAIAVAFFAALIARPRELRPAVIGTGVAGLVAGLWTLVAVVPNLSSSTSSGLKEFWHAYYLDGDGFAGGLFSRLEGVARGFQSLDAVLTLVVVVIAAVVVLVRRPLVGVLLVMPTFVAIALAAATILPIGTERIEVYLYPSYALLVAVAVAELAALVREWAVVVGAVALLAAFVLAVNATPLTTLAYPREEMTPLVRLVEQRRREGDVVVVYPSSAFAYGLATRYPIETVANDRLATGWAVKVRGPNIVVLPPNREHPQRWGGQLDRLTADGARIWLIGSHLFHGLDPYQDWPALSRMLEARGYEVVSADRQPGAELVLLVPAP